MRRTPFAKVHWIKLIAPVASLLFFSSVSSAQFGSRPEERELIRQETKAHREFFTKLLTTDVSRNQIDVKYYGLNLKISGPAPTPQISGSVTTAAVIVPSSLLSLTLDMSDSLKVDSVVIDGVNVSGSSVVHAHNLLTINTPRVYAGGENIAVTVSYHGFPVGTGFGSFGAKKLLDGTTDWFWTLSEPYGASDWWPCINHPSDKADSADITLTCDQKYTAVSQGKLVDVKANGDGTTTYRWKHRYPIASYLISATITNFNEFSYWFRYSPTDSMEIFNYVTPTIGSVNPGFQNSASLTPKMMQIYSNLFGLYPFIKEKYGHAEFGWGGGMEHQTLTSLGTLAYNESIIAHELAHQWFGDMITCRTWPDVWLNEGFATYCEALYRETQYGKATYSSEMAAIMRGSKDTTMGSVYVRDTSSVDNVFYGPRVYNKGASVLHMLRHVLGDSVFFAAMKTYANDPGLRYNTASTADFRRNCEISSGRDLAFFFDEWIFGENYPRYTYRSDVSKQGSLFNITLTIRQTTGTTNPTFFTMPVDVRFIGPLIDTTVTVLDNQREQQFTFTFNAAPDTAELDPQNWILKDVENITSGIDITPVPSTYVLEQNYPNPFNPTTTIRYSIPEAGIVRISIYNILGEELATPLNSWMAEGKHSYEFDGSSLASGTYLYRVQSGTFVNTKKMLLVR